MQNGPKAVMNKRRSNRPSSYSTRTKRWASDGTSGAPRSDPNAAHNARRNYERYLALAEAQVQLGDTIGAENFYQYAEHYFRSMSADRDPT